MFGFPFGHRLPADDPESLRAKMTATGFASVEEVARKHGLVFLRARRSP